MNREKFITQLVVQFANPVQPPQYDAPVLITSASMVVAANGANAYPPVYQMEPAISTDITDELLSVLNERMSAIGLQVIRGPEAPQPANPAAE